MILNLLHESFLMSGYISGYIFKLNKILLYGEQEIEK
jgi:hypothetical protein